MCAEELTQRLEDNHGIARESFAQTMMNFAGPTEEYERLITAEKLKHNGNPCLSWQASHVETYKDANDNKRPIKPKNAKHKKIDGVVAGIMALAGALQIEDGGSYYDSHGPIFAE